MTDRVVGYVRFSVVTQTHKRGYQQTRDVSVDEALKTMLAPERIRQRLRFLELMPLASLASQTDKDFEVILLTSTHLDAASRDVLRDIESRLSFLQVVELGLDDSVADFIAGTVTAGTRTISFRLDDDDAVHPDHIASLRAAAVGRDECVLSAPDGLYVQAHGTGFLVKRKHYVTNAYGIGYVSGGGSTIWTHGNHSTIAGEVAVSNPAPEAWIRSVHAGMDTRDRLHPRTSRFVEAEQMAAMLPAFGFIDFDRYHEVMLATGPVAPGIGLRSRFRWTTRAVGMRRSAVTSWRR